MNLIHTSTKIFNPADSQYLMNMMTELDTMQSRSSRNVAWSATIDFIRQQAIIVLNLVGSHSAGNIIEMFIQQYKHHESGSSAGKALVGDYDFFSYDYSLFRDYKDENVTCADIPFAKWPIEDISCATLLNLVVNTLNGRKILIYCANYFVAKSLLYIFKRMQIVQNSVILMDDCQENRVSFFNSSSGLLLTHKHDLCCAPIQKTFLILLSPPRSLKWNSNVYLIINDTLILKELSFLHNEEKEEGEISPPSHSTPNSSSVKLVDKYVGLSKPYFINAIMQASFQDTFKSCIFRPLTFADSSFSLFIFQSLNLSFGTLYTTAFEERSFEIFGFNCSVSSVSLSLADFQIITNFSNFCGFNIVSTINNNIDILRMQEIMNCQPLSAHLSEFLSIFDNPKYCPQIASEYGCLQNAVVKLKESDLLYTINGINTSNFTENVLHLDVQELFGNDFKTVNCHLLELVGLQKQDLIHIKSISDQIETISGVTAALLLLKIDNLPISINTCNGVNFCPYVGSLVRKVYFKGADLPENVINGLGIVFSCFTEIPKIQNTLSNPIEHTEKMNKTFNVDKPHVNMCPDIDAFSFTLLAFSKIFPNIANGIFLSYIEQLASISPSDIVGCEYIPCLLASTLDLNEFAEIIRKWCVPLKFKYSSEMGLKSYLASQDINPELLQCISTVPSHSKERYKLNLKNILLAKGELEKDVYNHAFGYFIKYLNAPSTFNLE